MTERTEDGGKEMPEDGFSPETCREIVDLAAERRMAPGDLFWFVKAIVRRETSSMVGTLQRIVDNRDNRNWRKPEIVAEAEGALAGFRTAYGRERK